jgi:hypothetical protein
MGTFLLGRNSDPRADLIADIEHALSLLDT